MRENPRETFTTGTFTLAFGWVKKPDRRELRAKILEMLRQLDDEKLGKLSSTGKGAGTRYTFRLFDVKKESAIGQPSIIRTFTSTQKIEEHLASLPPKKASAWIKEVLEAKINKATATESKDQALVLWDTYVKLGDEITKLESDPRYSRVQNLINKGQKIFPPEHEPVLMAVYEAMKEKIAAFKEERKTTLEKLKALAPSKAINNNASSQETKNV